MLLIEHHVAHAASAFFCSPFEQAAVLTLDPDRGINAFALAPRLLVNLADLPATQLIQPGSRVEAGWNPESGILFPAKPVTP